jgi:ribosome-binding ATPase
MLIGVVGAPNKGKSTFFSACTLVDAQIANYPFTTVTPNRGVTYVRAPCPHAALGLSKCDPKNSRCSGGTRLVPVGIIDVPGLVPDAHLGKGLGNKFLDSIREADAVIQVVDATGRTDLQGNPCDFCPPEADAEFLKNELAMWLAGIMARKGGKGRGAKEVAESLSGLRITEAMLSRAAGKCGLDISDGLPDGEGAAIIAREIVDERMPFAIAFNKIDVSGARRNYEKARSGIGENAFACSAAMELALRKASERGIIDYAPGGRDFAVIGAPDEKQQEALEKMRAFLLENGGTGVQDIIDWVVYRRLQGIIVYPVEDEHRYSNHKGEVLPDAFLVPRGTTAIRLAAMVHTDLAGKFIGAIDAKRRVRIGADHLLENGDVVKIIAGR